VINCDAMQMYRGLPVITNKLPESEQQGVKHHLLDFIGLEETPWTVNKFVKESTKVFDEVRGRGKVPILVGGTGYYAFGSLFEGCMLGDDMEGNEGKEGLSDGENQAMGDFEVLNASTETMLEKLRELDPAMAKSWHPNDRRKIQRSLEICLKRGRKVSEIYREQMRETGTTNDQTRNGEFGAAGGLQHDALILWLSASDKPLKARLNSRVDQMVSDGLLTEALDLARVDQKRREDGINVDTTKGIWVSIGYKEMKDWAAKHLEDKENFPPDSKLALECIESVKAGTRQYAKRQERYIRIRLANALKQARALDKLFLLDTTNLEKWEERVTTPAQDLIRAFLAGDLLPEASTLSPLAKEKFEEVHSQGSNLSYRVANYCEACGKTTMTEKEWAGHLTSRTHKKAVQAKQKRALALVDTAKLALVDAQDAVSRQQLSRHQRPSSDVPDKLQVD
jgi:tRNA dimethylallyltransferase